MAIKQSRINPNQSFSTTRMEAFSDGVFAIAITLLVLDIVVHPPGTLLHQVIHAWPSYIAYIISFLTIGAAWINHAAMTERLMKIDAIFVRLNLLILMVVVFLPFPTRLVAESLNNVADERVAVTLYGLTLLAISVFGFFLYNYARREKLFKQVEQSAQINSERRGFRSIIIFYGLAIVIGLLLPRLAVLLYFCISLYLVIPVKEMSKLFVSRN